MSKKKHLQEIYGEGEDDNEIEEEDITNALIKMIAQLKEKYGSEWVNHIQDSED